MLRQNRYIQSISPDTKGRTGAHTTATGGPLPRLRRRDRARQLIRDLRARHQKRTRRRLKKRKAALALSASTIGFGAAGMVPPVQPLPPQIEIAIEDSGQRLPASQLSASDELREAMIEEEGVRERVYRDVAGHLTVGVGHLVTPRDGLSQGDRVDRARILKFFDRDIALAEGAAKRLAGDVPLFQHEFDALVDLVYNVGEGNVSPHRSPRLNAALEQADYDAIADELHYHNAGGSRANGLVYRSERRANIFENADYADPRQRA